MASIAGKYDVDDFELITTEGSVWHWATMVVRFLQWRNRCRHARAVGVKGQMLVDQARQMMEEARRTEEMGKMMLEMSKKKAKDIPGNIRYFCRQPHQES